MKRLALLVGLDEDDMPVVAGAWEISILEIMDQDEEDKIIARAKREWFPDITEWRVVTLLVDDDHLKQAFDARTIYGSVERE